MNQQTLNTALLPHMEMIGLVPNGADVNYNKKTI